MKRLNSKGVSLIDITMWLAVVGFLVPALTGLIWNTVRVSANAVSDQKELRLFGTHLNVVLSDLRSASKNSLGNLVINGNFEMDLSTSVPLGWSSSVGGNGAYEYINESPSDNVENGQGSIALRCSDDGAATYSTAATIKLHPGNAYMLTARIRSSNPNAFGRVRLVGVNGQSIATGETSSSVWQQVVVRYPAEGLYTDDMLTNDEAIVSLSVRTTAPSAYDQNVYFDNVSLSSLYAVIHSSVASQININSTVGDNTLATESTGFQFARWENGALVLYRYRATPLVTGGAAIAREKYEGGQWIGTWGGSMLSGLRSLAIGYSSTYDIPGLVKDEAVTVTLSAMQNTGDVKTKSLRVFTTAP